jgi:hypothetical protein
MEQAERALSHGAYDIAKRIVSANLDWVDEVNVRNTSIHIVTTDDVQSSEREDELEQFTDEVPYTFSEWWVDRSSPLNTNIEGVISPYWPAGGQLSKEQYDLYDEFILEYADV